MPLQPHRLRAPRTDGGVLADPPLDEAGALLADNAGRLDAWDHDFQGRRSGRLRAMARQEAFAAARAFHQRHGLTLPPTPEPTAPLVVTGHQPELFHPGVWIKNFAVGGLARQQAGVGLNLIVDNDIPKRASVRVPNRSATDVGLRTVPVEFDDWAGELPYEDWLVQDEGRFDTFADRVRATLGDLVPDPLVDDFWPLAREAGRRTDRIGLRFAAARHQLEARWGVHNWEVPLSAVCETDAFRWFACHLLARLPRFQQVHNDALDRYRDLYGIRSKHHPVPALGRRDGDWLEAPFWAWRDRAPRRRSLLARQQGRTLQLRIAGEAEPLIDLPLSADREACCAVEQLRPLFAQGVRIRTRALTTTMFARLLLGQLFVHGIGGAKYDELGDAIIRAFFGLEPPPYLTLSMTVWLGLGSDPAGAADLAAVEREVRDLAFNPDRHLGPSPSTEVAELVARKRATIAGPQQTRRQRVARWAELRRINEALQPAVAALREPLLARREALRAVLKRNAIASSREYAAVIHSALRLRSAFEVVVPGGLGG